MKLEESIDISPEKGGSKGRKTTIFQETELKQIMENPSDLTKEGILKKMELWKSSNNKHVLMKYETMLKRCNAIKSSGKTNKGEVKEKAVEAEKLLTEKDMKGIASFLQDINNAKSRKKLDLIGGKLKVGAKVKFNANQVKVLKAAYLSKLKQFAAKKK